MRKRILSVILAASIMFALTPNTAMAAKMDGKTLQILETTEKEVTDDSSSDMEGLGTEASPYRIKNAEQLRSFADMVNGIGGAPNTGLCAVLACSIDLSGICGADIGSWTPIGTNVYPYTGIFDGNSFAITGLYYHKSNSSYAGLFGSNAGIIKNLEVVGTDISAGGYTGGICGYNNGTITGCYNAASVKGAKYTGGICGYNDGGGTVSICYNTGTVNGSKYVGGICGYNTNMAGNCYNMGAVNGDSTSIGGICGYNRAFVSNCFNTGTVNGGGKKYIGSICGYNHSKSSFLNCYYLITGEDKENYGVGMTQEQFASGEVCWLLNEGKSENVVWHQTCGAGFPAFGGKIVYQVRRPKTGGSADEMIIAYTNEKEKNQAQNNVSAEANESENTNKHVYQEPEWEWKKYKSAKAVFTCQDCGEKLSLEASISPKTTEATCGKEGKTVYTASVDRDGETYTDKKTVKLEKLAHKPLEKKLEVPASCTESGSRECWICPDCGKYFKDEDRKTELSQNKVIIPATGHQYSEPDDSDWVWAADYTTATVTFTCTVCHQTANEEATVTCKTTASCTTEGKTVYTAVVKFKNKTYKREKTISGQPIPHSYGEPKWKWADDYTTADAVFTCVYRCGTTETIPAKITRKETDSTCANAGKIEYTAVATFGGKEYQCPDVKTKPLEKTEHSYGTGEPEWSWNLEKNPPTATATFICTVCQTPESKTVEATKEEISGTTCETPGKVIYTATVTFNGTTYTGQNEKELPAKHSLYPIDAKAPTCVVPGNKQHWKCSVCSGLFSDSAGKKQIEEASIIIPAAGHKFELVPDNQNIYMCTECKKKFSVTELSDGTTLIYSVEEDAVIQQDEAENDNGVGYSDEENLNEAEPITEESPSQSDSEESQEDSESQDIDGQDAHDEQDEESMQNEQREEDEQNEDESDNSGIPDVPENAARYGLIYSDGEGAETDPMTADSWEESAVNLRAESARNGATQTVQAQQQQGYPLWASVIVLAILAGMVMFFILRRKDNQ